MITIYRVDIMDGNDGRSIESSNYFLALEDANDLLNKHQRRSSKSKIDVWEKGEYSPDAVKKAKALAKLTDEDKKVLGLI